MDNEQRTTDNGQRTTDNGQWITDNGQQIFHEYLVRFSLQNCVFIPHTINRRYRDGASRHVITSHVKTGSTWSHGNFSLAAARHASIPWEGSASTIIMFTKFNLAAARHAIVFDECTAVPIATIAMSDYGRTNDNP